MKCVLRAWGQLKRGFQVLVLCEIWSQGIEGVFKGGLRCWHLVKYVLRAWGQFKRGLEFLALGEMCFEGMGSVEKGA